MKKRLLILFLGIMISGALTAQTEYESRSLKVGKKKEVNIKDAPPAFDPQLMNLEAPNPAGDSYQEFLMQQKIEIARRFPPLEGVRNPEKSNAPQPAIGKGFAMYRQFANGFKAEHTGGIPNDNTLAISNDGILLGAINSILWAYDTRTDTLMFNNSLISLGAFVSNLNNGHVYDPKLIYDEAEDRFILVFLQGNKADQTRIVVCFSSTNDPRDPWYTYELPGNPLNNNRWTDFPAISITGDELFITGNLIIPDVSWQIGFDGSVIWQLKKSDGFANKDSITTRFYSDIRTNGRLVRNLHPVSGIHSYAPAVYFLSNRNFDISNDTIFVLEIDGAVDNPSTQLNITIGKTNLPYGVPPNGRQLDTDQTDPTKGLQTNDARVLGAITNGDWIQFVSTTRDPVTGLASIYHGHIQHPGTAMQSIQANIIGHSKRDYAYPNIAFAGNEDCDVETIIGFDYSSPLDDPGVAAVYYGNDSTYSEVITVKEGLNYVDKHSDSYERWGDYFGIQRRYNQPGKVWIGGFYGLANRTSGTWFNELGSPDFNLLAINHTTTGLSQFCESSLQIQASGGVPPYRFSFNGSADSSHNQLDGICNNDTVFYRVSDARGCMKMDTVVINSGVTTAKGAYPNPFHNYLLVQFTMDTDAEISVWIYSEKGVLVEKILQKQAQKGLNELRFSLDPLSAGTYIVRVMKGEENLLVSKVFKVD